MKNIPWLISAFGRKGGGGPWNVSEPDNLSNCYFCRNGYGLFTSEVISSLKGSFAEVAIRWRQTPDAIKDKYNKEAARVRVSPTWFALEIPVSTTLLLVRSLMTHLVDSIWNYWASVGLVQIWPEYAIVTWHISYLQIIINSYLHLAYLPFSLPYLLLLHGGGGVRGCQGGVCGCQGACVVGGACMAKGGGMRGWGRVHAWQRGGMHGCGGGGHA